MNNKINNLKILRGQLKKEVTDLMLIISNNDEYKFYSKKSLKELKKNANNLIKALETVNNMIISEEIVEEMLNK